MNISLIPEEKIEVITCSQGDTTLRKWTFNLISNYQKIQPTGDVSLICSNGAEVPIIKDGYVLLCDCTEELSTESGIFWCKIKIENNNEVIHSALLKLIVEEKP